MLCNVVDLDNLYALSTCWIACWTEERCTLEQAQRLYHLYQHVVHTRLKGMNAGLVERVQRSFLSLLSMESGGQMVKTLVASCAEGGHAPRIACTGILSALHSGMRARVMQPYVAMMSTYSQTKPMDDVVVWTICIGATIGDDMCTALTPILSQLVEYVLTQPLAIPSTPINKQHDLYKQLPTVSKAIGLIASHSSHVQQRTLLFALEAFADKVFAFGTKHLSDDDPYLTTVLFSTINMVQYMTDMDDASSIQIVYMISRLYFINQRLNGGAGFPAYHTVLTNAVSRLTTASQLETCLDRLLQHVVTHKAQSDTMQRSIIVFYLDLCEQVLHKVEQRYLQDVILPLAHLYLAKHEYADTFASANSVLLAIFTKDIAGLNVELTPFYIQHAIAHMTAEQQQAACSAVLASLCKGNHDAMAWYAIQQLAQHNATSTLIHLMPAVNLNVFHHLLDTLEPLVQADSSLLPSILDCILDHVDLTKKETAFKWYLSLQHASL
jgi:hypothetical protein